MPSGRLRFLWLHSAARVTFSYHLRNENHYIDVKMNAVQCKMARAALGWGVRDLAMKANVSTQTVTRLERGEQLKDSTIENIKSVFLMSGIEFIPQNGGGPGVRLRYPL